MKGEFLLSGVTDFRELAKMRFIHECINLKHTPADVSKRVGGWVFVAKVEQKIDWDSLLWESMLLELKNL